MNQEVELKGVRVLLDAGVRKPTALGVRIRAGDRSDKCEDFWW